MTSTSKNVYRFPLLLCLGCLLCLSIITWEYRVLASENGHHEVTQMSQQKQSFVRHEAEQKGLMPIQNYQAVVASPLFFSGRKAQEVVADMVVVEEGDLKLSGIVLTPQGFVALIRDDQGAYHKLASGKDIQGWTVANVEKDRVALIRNQESRELSLFESKNKHDLTAKELEACFKNKADLPLEECFKHPEKYAHKNESAGVHT